MVGVFPNTGESEAGTPLSGGRRSFVNTGECWVPDVDRRPGGVGIDPTR